MMNTLNRFKGTLIQFLFVVLCLFSIETQAATKIPQDIETNEEIAAFDSMNEVNEKFKSHNISGHKIEDLQISKPEQKKFVITKHSIGGKNYFYLAVIDKNSAGVESIHRYSPAGFSGYAGKSFTTSDMPKFTRMVKKHLGGSSGTQSRASATRNKKSSTSQSRSLQPSIKSKSKRSNESLKYNSEKKEQKLRKKTTKRTNPLDEDENLIDSEE